MSSNAPPNPTPLPLSGYVITKNEAAHIEACLRSLGDCAEILVVDSGSTDDTEAIVQRLIAEGYPIRWIARDWPGFAAQKQFALDQCTQPWVVNLDADERLNSEARRELPTLLAAPPEVAGWRMKRHDYLMGYGYPHATAGDSPRLRLARRDRVHYDLGQRVHESLLADGPTPASPRGAMLHFRTLALHELIERENSYSSLKASQRLAQGRRKSPWRILLSPIGYFLRYWITREFWRCGWAGFILSANAAVYAYLTEAKAWQTEAMKRTPPVDVVD